MQACAHGVTRSCTDCQGYGYHDAWTGARKLYAQVTCKRCGGSGSMELRPRFDPPKHGPPQPIPPPSKEQRLRAFFKGPLRTLAASTEAA